MTQAPEETGETSDLTGIDERSWEVVVIGAGPAGATAALCLASAGHEVLLLDKHPFPREKVCGDALIPDALSCLTDLGLCDKVRAIGHSVGGLAAMSPSGHRVEAPAECITLKRSVLDDMIVGEAVANGAVFRVAPVSGLLQQPVEGTAVTIRGMRQRVRARIGIVATGADVSLVESLGMLQRRSPSAVALRCYVRSPVQIDELLVSFDRAIVPGYAWIFPLGDHEYNIGCGIFYRSARHKRVNLRRVFRSFTTEVAIARDVMHNAEAVTPLRGAMLRAGLGGASSYNGAGILCIGECIGTTYPHTGEGIGKAMETGILAARHAHAALARDDITLLGSFPHAIATELKPRYTGYHIAERWLAIPWLNDLVAKRIGRSRPLQEAVTGVVNETVDPRAIFSWRSLLLPHLKPPTRA